MRDINVNNLMSCHFCKPHDIHLLEVWDLHVAAILHHQYCLWMEAEEEAIYTGDGWGK